MLEEGFELVNVHVHASIDGRPVALTDFQFDSVINWGYRSLSGRIPESVTWAEQEAPVRLWLDDGTEAWAGKLSLDPQTERGTRSIKAEGHAQDLVAATTRMFYRIDGAEGWAGADGDPHNYNESEKFNLTLGKGHIAWHVGDGTTAYASTNQAGVVLWVEGALVTRYSIFVETSVSFGNMDLLSHHATGPSGTRTLEGTHSLALGAGGTASYARNLTTPADLLSLRCQVTGAFTPAQKHRVKVNQIKVYGRTTDDAFSASDVVIDVGTDAGFDTSLVQSNSLAILPLDWTEEHPGLLDYMAELTDWHWEALGPLADGTPQLAFGPYGGETYTASQAYGVKPNWENQKRYNGVEVPYETVTGRHRSAIVMADPDPFPGQSVIYTTDPLEDPQPDNTLPTAVATAHVPVWSSQRANGRIVIGEVKSSTNEPLPGLKVKVGGTVNVAERTDLGPQRIVGMTHQLQQNGSVASTAEVGADFNVIRLLAEVQRSHRKRRRRRRGGPRG